jgi:hypothetical protein
MVHAANILKLKRCKTRDFYILSCFATTLKHFLAAHSYIANHTIRIILQFHVHYWKSVFENKFGFTILLKNLCHLSVRERFLAYL